MKNKFGIRALAMLALVTLLLCSFVACGPKEEIPEEPEHVDYAAELKLDMNSSTVKQEVSVHIYIDGDTTHFNVPESVMEGVILKARYLAINTPESTGRIEPWGKAAYNFTKDGYAMVIKDGKCGLIDTTGTLVIPCEYDYLNGDFPGMAEM